jgi:hypothetical protein
VSFQTFERAIVAAPLKRVAAHWNAARGARPMPAWTDIRPSALAGDLSIIWSWKYDPVGDRFTGRLAGDAIEAIFGKSFRGAAMRDLFGPEEYDRIFSRHKRVAVEPCLFRGTGLVFHHLNRYGTGERIILPLSDGGTEGDGIFGATVYEARSGTLPKDVEMAGEREEWFALG